MKNIYFNFSMPEMLVLYSFLMISQDKFVAIAALTLGIAGRAISTVVLYGSQNSEKSLEEKESELLVS